MSSASKGALSLNNDCNIGNKLTQRRKVRRGIFYIYSYKKSIIGLNKRHIAPHWFSVHLPLSLRVSSVLARCFCWPSMQFDHYHRFILATSSASAV